MGSKVATATLVLRTLGRPARREESRLSSVRKRARGDVEEVGEGARVKDGYL
jgi:hypothetical protein